MVFTIFLLLLLTGCTLIAYPFAVLTCWIIEKHDKQVPADDRQAIPISISVRK